MNEMTSPIEITSRHLTELQQVLGANVNDMCYLLGISISKWSQLKSSVGGLGDPALCMMIRWYLMHPELAPIKPAPTAREIFDLFNRVTPITKNEFSLLFGQEKSASGRWLRDISPVDQSPAVKRLFVIARDLLSGKKMSEQQDIIENVWKPMIKAEGESRGLADVFKEGAWKSKEERSSSIHSKAIRDSYAARKKEK